MTGSEFALILAWVLLPPVVLALILVVASACISLAMMFSSPLGLGSYIGIRDTPVMWAPFAFIAVALALPIAIWWAARGGQP